MSDDTTTVAQLRDRVRAFTAEREWEQFHTPKNLAMSIAIEAAEVMELFQWREADGVRERLDDPAFRAHLGEELADVCCYVFSLANAVGLDLSEAVEGKIAKNAAKYPAERFRGRFEAGEE